MKYAIPILLYLLVSQWATAQCDITITQTLEGQCDDNGTPFNASDDTFIVTLNATAVNGGASNEFIVSLDNSPLDTFIYGQGGGVTVPADGANYTLVLTDLDNPNCQTNVSVSQAPCCSIDLEVNTVPITHSNHPNTGQIQLCIDSGTPPFQFDVSPTVNASIYEIPGNCLYNYVISALPTDNYQIEITDALGCSITLNETISTADCTGFLLENIAGNPVSCANGTDGTMDVTLFDEGNATSITVDVGNGVPPQTFTDLENITLTDLPAGSYNVVLYDNNGCAVTYIYNPVVVSEPDPIRISGAASNTTAIDTTDGVATVCVGGGNGNFTITVEPDSMPTITTGSIANCADESFIISDLPAGSYDVIATDNKGCADTLHIVINDPSCPLELTYDTTSITCGGTATGGILATVSGGTGPYSLSLDGGVSTVLSQADSVFDVSNLAAGTYDIVITDANGCAVSSNTHVDIIQNTPISIDAIIAHVTNNGSNNGELNLCVNGGVGDYTFAISPNSGTVSEGGATSDCSGVYNVSDLPAGIYEVSIMDELGCTDTVELEVLEPTCPDFTVIEIETDTVSCYGGRDGSVTITVQGGQAPYTYDIPGVQTVTTDSTTYTFAGLEDSEDYEVFVTDNNGCFAPYTVAFPLEEPEPLRSIISFIPPCAGQNNGVICLLPEEGTPGYMYNVLDSDKNPQTVTEGPHPECQVDFHLVDIAAGLYHVEVIDTNGCKSHAVVTVPEVTVNVTADILPSCTGVNAGSIDISYGGGTAPYTWAWADGFPDEDRTNLPAGNYTVTITDNRGCEGVGNFTVEVIDPSLALAADPSCQEQAAGAINAMVTDGTANYDINWSGTSSGSTTSNADNFSIADLNIGSYTLTIEDSRGCTATATTTVDEYDLAADLVPTNTCEGQNNGAVVATPSAVGVPDFTYNWNNGGTTNIIENVAAGTYTVTITDANGCPAVNQATVEEYQLEATPTTTDVCIGDNTGSISVATENTSGALTFEWSNQGVTNPLQGVGAGDYTVTITDQLGCTITTSATINEFDSPTVTASEDVTIIQGNATTLSADATGGTTPYSYQWSPTGDNPNGSETNVSPGVTTTYFINLTDANGCTAFDTVLVTVVPDVILVMPTAFSPNGDGMNDVYEPVTPNGDVDVLTFRVFNRWGKVMHDDATAPWDGRLGGTEQPIGTYVYLVEYLDILGEKYTLKGHFTLIR